jgi:hypothetical protein
MVTGTRKQIAAKFRKRQSDRRVIVWMDKVDWDHEVGSALGGNKVYPSRRDLETNAKCLDECGIVQVEMRLRRVVRHSNFFARKASVQPPRLG